MIIKSESEMIKLGADLARTLSPPATIELLGDIGTGKTTLTKGIAQGLGIKVPITSPSFTVNKKYHIDAITLSHYDFYRLPAPGIMTDELDESIADPSTITIIEWAQSVADILPKDRTQITISYNSDGTRTVTIKKGSHQ